MPHFVLDCSDTILVSMEQEDIIKQVYLVVIQTGLFLDRDIKVRMNPYTTYLVGPERESFIHVFANIMEGRSTEQKAHLAEQIVRKLTALFPDVPNIAINVREFEKATYFNRNMI